MSTSAQILLLLLAGLLAHGGALGGGFHYDDMHSVVHNPHIRDPGRIPSYFADPGAFSGDADKAMYRPLLLVTYALNYALHGYEARGYLLVNLIAHMGCALLVWIIARGEGFGRGALLAGALFAAHPLAAEPVNYISSRSESLAALLALGSFALFGRQRQGWALLCFAGALLAKSTAIVLPVLLFLRARARGDRIAWRAHLPFWAVALAYVGLIAANRFLGSSLERAPRSFFEQALTQLKALPYYLKLVAVPAGLNVEHQFFAARGPGEWAVVLGLLLGGSLALFALFALPAAQRPWPAWAFVALLPASLMPLNVLVNEHRLYLSVAGLCLWAGYVWGGRARALGLVLVGALALLSLERSRAWADELTLWADAAEKSPAMPRVHVHLGNALRERGRAEEARRAYERTLALDPGHRAARTNLANLLYEAGMGGGGREHLERAVEEYGRVLELDPHYREALNNLGSAYMLLGREGEAEDVFRRAVEAHPHFADAYFNLGLLRARQGDWQGAAGYYAQAIERQEDGEFYFELGNARVHLGELEGAEAAYRRAAALGGGEPRYAGHLAEVLLVRGERALQEGDREGAGRIWAEARALFRQILAQRPGDERAARRLAQLEERLP